jgi:diguanylate cyclase (GGDEF)-like protein
MTTMIDTLCQIFERLGQVITLKAAETGVYLWAKGDAQHLLGWSQSNPTGLTDADLVESLTAVALRAADAQAMAQGDLVRSLHQFPIQGTRVDIQAFRQAFPASQDAPAQILCVWSSNVENQRKETQLQTALTQLEEQQRAYQVLRREVEDKGVRDISTGLYSRAHFHEQLRREVDLSQREQREFAVVSMSIDGLAEFGRDQGLEAREQVLESLGRLLRSNTRMMDAPCRMEDGRFAVLLSGVGLATAHSRMEGLRRQCASHIVAHHGQELHFTVSMGVASYPHTSATLTTLVDAADKALAEAIRKGGNRVSLAPIKFEPR